MGSDPDLDMGSDLGTGSDLGGADAVCLGAGSFTLDLARRPAVVPVAVCGAGGALLSADGSRLSRADAALASSRDDTDNGSAPAAGSVARGDTSDEARGATISLRE